jgi:hypothetical protein
MEQTPALHDCKLRAICLPASHDSDSFWFGDKIVPEPAYTWLPGIQDKLNTVADAINKIPGIGKIVDPFEYMRKGLVQALTDLGTTQDVEIAGQLAAGIRCLDLRLYDDGATFWTHHGLKSNYDIVATFGILSQYISQTKEIVYVTCSHTLVDSGTFRSADFLALVGQSFADSQLFLPQYDSGGNVTNDPFEQTYTQITTQNGTTAGRLIVSFDDGTMYTDRCCFPKTYSVPSNNGVVGGKGSEMESYSDMLDDQATQFANRDSRPYAVSMTLTPSDTHCTAHVLFTLKSGLLILAASLYWLYLPISLALIVIAAGLYIGSWVETWRTLMQLSEPVAANLLGDMYSRFQDPTKITANAISMIYIDFVQATFPTFTDLAIAYSTVGATRERNKAVPSKPGA